MRPIKVFIMGLILLNSLLFISPFEKLFKQNEFITLITFISLVVSLGLIKYYPSGLLKWYIFLLIIFASLVFESIIFYGTFFVYPHVFSKITPLFLFFAVFALIRKYKIKLDLEVISKLIFIFYFIDLFLLGWIQYFSPFQLNIVPPEFGAAGDSRVFHASLIMLFIIPLLLHQGRYIAEGRKKDLILFLGSLIIILVQNHRSVWLAALAGFIVNYITLSTRLNINFNIVKKIVVLTIIISVGVSSVFFLIPNSFNEVIYRFNNAISLEAGSTGAWRLEQVFSYIPLVSDKIIFGLRFQGFELDSPSMTNTGFVIGTGHHFHNAYLELLFYFGIVGFILIFGFLIKLIKDFYSNISQNYNYSFYIAFLVSCFVFSFSYTLPHFIWGIIAIGISDIYSKTNNINK